MKRQSSLCSSFFFFSFSSDGRELRAKLPFAARPFTQQNKILTRCQFLTAVFNNISTSWCLTSCSLIEVLSFLRKTKSKPSGYKRLQKPLATESSFINPLKPELNPICYLLALLAYHFLHVSRIRVKSLTIRLLISYIYGAPILDVSRSHTTTQHSR